MNRIGIIGGTGLSSLQGLEISSEKTLTTPYGDPSSYLTLGRYNEHEVIFLPRHGAGHTLPPHKVNYRANIWALKEMGVTHVIAVNAVGGIKEEMNSGRLVIPDQIIDYTSARKNTFYEDNLDEVVHVDFSYPYCAGLIQLLEKAAKAAELELSIGATYAATQGPRLESVAEINKLERDGCDIVGMTGMPEAALAREKELCYACIALVVNKAAGRGEGIITMDEIEANLRSGMTQVHRLLKSAFTLIN